ncbi:MAG: site-2 protease family protein [Planctomycetota bacterium]|nr:site-2 protease family protein [Planctomycetota bacterium]
MTLAFFIEELASDPVYYISVVVAVVISICLHELGHGVAAIWQGDDTPRELGHMTLDPRAHMPPLSWGLLLLVGISYGLMPVNPRRFRGRYGSALVAAAGPAVNVILAALGIVAWVGWLRLSGPAEPMTPAGNFQSFLYIFAQLNIVLALFNLLPLPPLDGSAIAANLSPAYERAARDPARQQLFMGVFVLFFIFGGQYLFKAADAVMGAALRLAFAVG